jgi:hypothetical protein
MNTILILWILSLCVNALYTLVLPTWDALQAKKLKRERRSVPLARASGRSAAKAA